MNKLINKFKNASPAAKASMALLFANLVLKGLSLISGPIFTRIMTTEQYGIVSTFLSWQSLLSVIVTLNLSSGVFNNGMLDFKEDRDSFQFSLLVISTGSTGIFFGIFCLFKQTFLKLFELPDALVYIMFIYFLFVPAYSFWSGRQRYEYKYKALTIITIAMSIVSMVLGIIAVVLTPSDSDAVAKVFATEGVNVVIGAFFYIFIAYKSRFRCKLSYCKYALKFNIPLIPHYMSMYVLASSDRIMITKMVSSSATAIYSVAYTIASVINIVWQSIEASLSPWIYEKLSINEKQPIKKLTKQIMLLFAVMCIVCTLFAPEIMAVLAPASYSEGIYVIPSVAAGVFFTALYSLYMRVELYYKETGFATIATTVAAILNIVLNFIFIKIFGFVAAGYTTMTCYAMLALFHYINVKKRKYDDVFDNKTFFIISFSVIIISMFISVLYSWNVVRYIVILLILIALIIKKDNIIKIIKRG